MPKSPLHQILTDALKGRRNQHRMTQEQVAPYLCISPRALQGWGCGRGSNWSRELYL